MARSCDTPSHPSPIIRILAQPRRANQRHYSIITPSVLQTSTVKFAGESETFSRSQDEVFETHRGACHHYASAIALVVGRAFARPVGIDGRTMRPPTL